MWLLLVSWMLVAVLVSTVCGRVLGRSGRHHLLADSSPAAPATRV